jgi:hypothetical protein
MAMVSIRLLRTLTDKAGDIVRALERTSIVNTYSIIFGEDSMSSLKTKMTEASMPKVRGEGDRWKSGG